MPDKTPRGLVAQAPTWPVVLQSQSRFQPSSVSGFPHPCLSSPLPFQLRPDGRSPSGLPGFSDVSLLSMPRPEDSGGPPHPRLNGCFVWPSGTLKPSASATSLSRSCTSTSGSAISPTAYRMLCLRLAHLVRCPLRRSSAMGPRLDTGGWLALTKTPLGAPPGRDFHPARYAELIPAR